MSSGQVSVRAPVVAGELGIIGAVAGQLVNVCREDRRWNKETACDERRHWRDRQLEAYSTFYAAAERYWRTVLSTPDQMDTAAATERQARLDRARSAAEGLYRS